MKPSRYIPDDDDITSPAKSIFEDSDLLKTSDENGVDIHRSPFSLLRRYAVIQIKTSGGNLSLDCDITGYNLDEIFECLLKKCKKYLEKSDELTDIYFYTEERA